jgi:hypothetical protein
MQYSLAGPVAMQSKSGIGGTLNHIYFLIPLFFAELNVLTLPFQPAQLQDGAISSTRSSDSHDSDTLKLNPDSSF